MTRSSFRLDAFRSALGTLKRVAPSYARYFWQHQRHWLWVIVPLLALIACAVKWWCFDLGSWTALNGALVFQPFVPLAVLILAWARRDEVIELQKEMSFLFPKDSPKRRGKLWPVFAGCLLILIAGITTAPTFGLFGLITIIVGGFYYLYGPFFVRLLWIPLALLYLTVPLPLYILWKIAIPMEIGGTVISSQVLGALVPGTHPLFGAVSMPHYQLVINPAICGLNVLLSSMALAFAYCLLNRIRAFYVVILMTATAAFAVILNFFRIILTGIFGNLAGLLPDGQRDTVIANICSLLLILLTCFLTLYLTHILGSTRFQRVSEFEADLREVASQSASQGFTVAEAATAMAAAAAASKSGERPQTPVEAAAVNTSTTPGGSGSSEAAAGEAGANSAGTGASESHSEVVL